MLKGWSLKEIRQSQNIAHFKQKKLVDVENTCAGYEHFLFLDDRLSVMSDIRAIVVKCKTIWGIIW